MKTLLYWRHLCYLDHCIRTPGGYETVLVVRLQSDTHWHQMKSVCGPTCWEFSPLGFWGQMVTPVALPRCLMTAALGFWITTIENQSSRKKTDLFWLKTEAVFFLISAVNIVVRFSGRWSHVSFPVSQTEMFSDSPFLSTSLTERSCFAALWEYHRCKLVTEQL